MEIILKLQPFVFKQTLFVKQPGNNNIQEIKVKLEEIPKFLSIQKTLKKVHLYGNLKMVKKIKEECLTKYNLFQVEFSINC